MRALLIALFCCAAGAQPTYINAGGPTIPGDSSSPTYQADQYFTGGVAWVDPAMGADILGTLRYGPSFSYNIPIQNGFYDVKFDLVEPNKTAAGQRVFTITANGIQSDPVDVFGIVGAINVQVATNLLVMVGNGHLRINFQATVGNAMVTAIEIRPSMIFAGIQTINLQLFTCLPPLSDTTCTQVPAAPAAMQWFRCISPCTGINLVHLKLADGTSATLYAEPVEASFQFSPAKWASSIPTQ